MTNSGMIDKIKITNDKFSTESMSTYQQNNSLIKCKIFVVCVIVKDNLTQNLVYYFFFPRNRNLCLDAH